MIHCHRLRPWGGLLYCSFAWLLLMHGAMAGGQDAPPPGQPPSQPPQLDEPTLEAPPSESPDPPAEEAAESTPLPPATAAEVRRGLQSPLEAARLRTLARLPAIDAMTKEHWAALEPAIDDSSAQVRYRVLQTFAQDRGAATRIAPAALARLADGERAGTQPVCLAAAHAVAAVGPAMIPHLVERLRPQQDETQYLAACEALAQFGDKAEPALRRLMTVAANAENDVIPALYVMKRMGPAAAPAVPLLIDRLADENFHHRYWSCQVLGAIGKKAEPAIPYLLDLLHNDVSSTRRHAAAALGDIGVASEPVLNGLTEGLLDPLAPVRQQAMLALGKFGPKAERALEKLKGLARDQGGSGQADAAWAWWQISQDAGAVDVLLRELRGANAPWDASKHLGAIAAEAEAIERIADMLVEPNAETRMYVVQTLQWIGPPAKGVVERLRPLLEDSEPEIRQAAAQAIAAINQPSP